MRGLSGRGISQAPAEPSVAGERADAPQASGPMPRMRAGRSRLHARQPKSHRKILRQKGGRPRWDCRGLREREDDLGWAPAGTGAQGEGGRTRRRASSLGRVPGGNRGPMGEGGEPYDLWGGSPSGNWGIRERESVLACRFERPRCLPSFDDAEDTPAVFFCQPWFTNLFTSFYFFICCP